MKKKLTVYIVGPMSGLPGCNFEAFDAAAKDLKGRGYIVLNPAQMDRDAGFDPTKEEFTGKVKEAAIKRDTDAVMIADLLAVLPNYEDSTGSNAEIPLGRWRGIPIYHYPSMIPFNWELYDSWKKNITLPSTAAEQPSITAGGLKDSGKRRSFESGSVRDDASGKGRPSLMPILALQAVSGHFEKGAEKYSARNWEKGQPYSSYFDSATRHLHKWWGGATDEEHLSAYAWNALCQLETFLRVERGILPKELDDRPEGLFDENGE